MKRRTLASALAVTATLALPGAALAAGQIRVLHASPDAPAVDVYVDGAKAVKALDRGEITPYLALKRGWHRYAVRPAGAAPRSAAVLKGRFWVPDNRASTLAATGFLSDLQIRRIRDAVRRPFDAARIRVVHLSPDAPAVDIVADGVGTVISGLKYPNASGYLVVPAGTYTFRVRAAGSPDDVLVVPGVELSAGGITPPGPSDRSRRLPATSRSRSLRPRTCFRRDTLAPRSGSFTLRLMHPPSMST